MRSALPVPPFTGDDARRADVVRLGRGGLDYVDVHGDGRSLVVAFFGRLPEKLGREHFVIEGGDRVRGIRVLSVRSSGREPELESVLSLQLDRVGDASTYTLRVAGAAGIDPLYSALPLTFDRGNERLADCIPDAPPAAAPPAPPAIDYLAKDYATFRRLLLDRASLVMPDWNESHIPDINVTLLELLAYAGDYLSYYQDAVATEAYLATARKRISVRRHARLLDYRMHEGCNARAWVSLTANVDSGPLDPRKIAFSTNATALSAAEVFAPLGDDALYVYAAHGPMFLYAWGNRTCALAAGATGATLRDAWLAAEAGAQPQRALATLAAGAHVMFEAVPYVVNGALVGADPAQRHVVRLTHVRHGVDPLYDTPIVEIAWAPVDALPFRLGIVVSDPSRPDAEPVACSLVWGNLVAVDHGAAVPLQALAPVPAEPDERYMPRLAQPNLTFAEPLVRPLDAALGVRDPRRALPQISELLTIDDEGHERTWLTAPDLLASGPADARYVVEVDENGVAALRFGDGVNGRRPPAGAFVSARYRTGNGSAGNVGAETIVNVTLTGEQNTGLQLSARNPLPACGGTDPEPIDDVRALAPSGARLQTQRAIAPDDYATIATRDPRVQRAAAIARWSGSRTIVVVALDPLGTEDVDPGLIADVAAALEAVRRIGHDVEVAGATYVPLRVDLNVTIGPGYQAGHVRSALESALGNAVQADGTRGLFHPDELSFGTSIAQSRIVARAFTIVGVRDVSISRLERLYAPAPAAAPAVLTFAPLEIPQLDNDRARPERGVLNLTLRGGR